jgi:hypothetical protein
VCWEQLRNVKRIAKIKVNWKMRRRVNITVKRQVRAVEREMNRTGTVTVTAKRSVKRKVERQMQRDIKIMWNDKRVNKCVGHTTSFQTPVAKAKGPYR